MELWEFCKGIFLMPEAVEELRKVQITEEEYQRLRQVFWQNKEEFYEQVKRRKDFRQCFLYCFCRMGCETYERYQEQGIDRQIFWDTFYDITLWCENCWKEYGEYGINQYDWLCHHIELQLFRLGRLEFERIESLWEVHAATDGGAENIGVRRDIHKGDAVIMVHIPQGEKLDAQACIRSFQQAYDFWGREYPYLCHSWLLYPGLGDILGPESNILRFQRFFQVVQTDLMGREAEERIFTKVRENPADYPEDTGLQRAAKQYLMEGKKLGNGLGVLL